MKIEVHFKDLLDNKVLSVVQLNAAQGAAEQAVEKYLQKKSNREPLVRKVLMGDIGIVAADLSTAEVVAEGKMSCNVFAGQCGITIKNV